MGGCKEERRVGGAGKERGKQEDERRKIRNMQRWIRGVEARKANNEG